MDDNFSPRVKDVITFSKEEALRLGHDFIGTELLRQLLKHLFRLFINNFVYKLLIIHLKETFIFKIFFVI
jgi:hypothetical protein